MTYKLATEEQQRNLDKIVKPMLKQCKTDEDKLQLLVALAAKLSLQISPSSIAACFAIMLAEEQMKKETQLENTRSTNKD